jgi:hypothetical protein
METRVEAATASTKQLRRPGLRGMVNVSEPLQASRVRMLRIRRQAQGAARPARPERLDQKGRGQIYAVTRAL